MTAKRNAAAVLISDVFDNALTAKPGSFEFFEQRERPGVAAGIIFLCPCGCKDTGSVKFDVVPRVPGDDQRWRWNGNREKPTLTPSINKTWGCRWHGYLTDGEFREC